MVNGKKPWHKVSARFIAAVSAAAMIATLTISGTAFALGNDATDSRASDADQSSTSDKTTDAQQIAVDKVGSSNGNDATNVDVLPAALSDHTVQGVSPNGTTINAFDYWLTRQDAEDNTDPANWDNIGINAGQQLKFYSKQGNLPLFNTWTGNTSPRTGMVYDTLQNGYPALEQNNNLGITQDESLAYLFDGTAHDGKAAYMDTQGLLQVDDSGYYYYNANRDAALGTFKSANYATLDTSVENNNKWTLYDTWGVRESDSVRDSQNGQFFPFNNASDILQEDANGSLTATQANSTSPSINHHFGLSMSSRFVQPNGGIIEKTNQDMQYHFSGDDDVWVYIDNVLVGDLGGIHVAASLDINFRTGDVLINGNEINTLRGLYQNAKKEDATKWNGDTFADGTYHTLNFFYLERGASDSNMSLKFNLKTIPESDIYKVDQNDEPVAGAKFSLYTTDVQYSEQSKELVGSGITGDDGVLVLTDSDKTIISFDDLHTKGKSNFILEETEVPAGYRKAVPTSTTNSTGMHLHYVEDNSSTTGTKSGVVLSVTDPRDSGSLWQTGSLALSKVTTTASTTIEDMNGKPIDPSKGLMFAVVLKRDKSKNINATDAWHGVYGDQLNGWHYEEDTGIQGIVDSIKRNNGENVFALTTSGGYEVTVENLPGNIEKYYYMLPAGQKDDAEYTVSYYYADGVTKVEDISVGNTVRLNFNEANDPFVRQFSENFYVSNVKNQLSVQKVDKNGKSLIGGVFSLYRVSSSETGNDANNADVNCTTAALNGEPYDTVTTANPTDESSLKVNGTATFPSANKGILESGTYCLVETKAPDGYIKSEIKTKVVVNDYGVFVDAGTDNDGLRVLRGAGWLVRPMSSFATNDDTDNTLTWIKSAPGSVTGFNDNGAPQVTFDGVTANASSVVQSEVVIGDATSEPMRLKYDVGDGADPVIKYGYSARERGGQTAFSFDHGFGIISSTQDAANTSDPAYNVKADRTGLLAGDPVVGTNGILTADVRLSNIVTGSVTAQFTDVAVSTLKISNAVEGIGPNLVTDAEFGFKIALKAGPNLPKLAPAYTYTVCTVDDTNANGYRDCGADQTMTLDADDSGTLNLKKDQIAVFADLPETTDYTITEITIPEQFYQLRVESKDNNATTITNGVASGVTAKNAQRHAHFVNSYGVKAVVSVTKRIEGADWTAPNGKNFDFTLTRTDATDNPNPVYVNENGTVIELPTNGITASTHGQINQGQTQNVTFDDLIFTVAGKYTFQVSENAENKASGWSYDSTTHTITVQVTKNANGSLKSEVTYDGTTNGTGNNGNTSGTDTTKPPTFVNTYIAVSSLPLTGGDASARDWLIGGSIFAIAAALALAATYEYRKRKNLTF